jgi:hypothetical protein
VVSQICQCALADPSHYPIPLFFDFLFRFQAFSEAGFLFPAVGYMSMQRSDAVC